MAAGSFETISGQRAPIFIHSFGFRTDSILKQTACKNNGFWFVIQDRDDISTKIDATLFLAVRVSDRVIWTGPYVDDFTGMNVTTASTPLYAPWGNGKDREFRHHENDVFLSGFRDDTEKVRKNWKE